MLTDNLLILLANLLLELSFNVLHRCVTKKTVVNFKNQHRGNQNLL
jgi:hypothetical protein